MACCGVCFLLGFVFLCRPRAEQFGLLLRFMRAPLHAVIVLMCVVSGWFSFGLFCVLRLQINEKSRFIP